MATKIIILWVTHLPIYNTRLEMLLQYLVRKTEEGRKERKIGKKELFTGFIGPTGVSFQENLLRNVSGIDICL